MVFVDSLLREDLEICHFLPFTFQLICSYLFMPLAFMMGADWADCQLVAELIGTKTFLNEFVAYVRLSDLIDNRESGEGPTMSVSIGAA